jgi:hypothetical protein
VKIFATRVWGFDPANWPVITFGLEGNRDKLLNEASPGDRIVFVGTQGEPTLDSMRGKLLGMAEIGRLAVDTLSVIDPNIRGPQDFDERGQFRWPKAILMVRAWRFEPQPKLLEVLAAQLPYNATPQVVLLSPEDTSSIMQKHAIELELPTTEALTKARLLDAALSSNRPTTGPTPTSWTASASRDVNRRSFTYAMRFGKSDIWKIGHAINVKERQKQINWHIPTEVVPHTWQVIWTQAWATEVDAHSMEQRLLKALLAKRTEAERVRCSEAEIWEAWKAAIGLS